MSQTFFGKYRGIVLNNIDPEGRGRILAQVPDVKQLIPTTWAEACLPFVGMQNGMFVVPMIGSGVWVEFEHGNPDYPIWTGGWYATIAEVPVLGQTTPGVQAFCVQTVLQNTFLLSDMPGIGGVLLKTSTGAMIKMDDTGIIIQNGKGASITMNGPTVTINLGAVVIT